MATVTWDSGVTSKGQASEVSYTYNNNNFATQLNTIPPYATINSVKITAKFQVNLYTNYGTLKIGGVEVANTGNTNNHDWVTIVNNLDITSYLTGKSGTENAGTLPDITVYASKRLGLIRTFKTQVTITWDYTVPTYTATFKNWDGTVLQSVSVTSGSTPSYSGATPTKAEDNQYTYSFSGWDPPLGAITADTTYTAQFTPVLREYKVTVICSESVSGETCNATGGGTYHFGDTVTLRAIDIPQYHKFNSWGIHTDSSSYNGYTNPFTFTVSGSTTVYCVIEHTGYTIKANILPNSDAGVVESGLVDDGLWFKGGVISDEGWNVPYERRIKAAINAVPNKGYKFVKWSDGDTSNPRKIMPTGNATYTAVFEKELINKIQIGTTYVTGIYLNTSTKKITFVIPNAVSITPSGADTLDGYHLAISNTVPSGATPIKGVQVGTTYVYTI